MALADVVQEVQEPCAKEYNTSNLSIIIDRANTLKSKAVDELIKQGFKPDNITTETYLNLRYNGTDTAIMTIANDEKQDYRLAFISQYEREFGFTLE